MLEMSEKDFAEHTEHVSIHKHHHSEEHIKAISRRLAKAIGHLESVKRMVERDEDCSDVLIQLAAVKAAVNNTGKAILKEHLSHCIVDAVRTGDLEEIEEFKKSIDWFIK